MQTKITLFIKNTGLIWSTAHIIILSGGTAVPAKSSRQQGHSRTILISKHLTALLSLKIYSKCVTYLHNKTIGSSLLSMLLTVK